MVVIPIEGVYVMPSLALESGEIVGAVEGTPEPGSEILVGQGAHEDLFVVVRQRWIISAGSTGRCVSIIVRRPGVPPSGSPLY